MWTVRWRCLAPPVAMLCLFGCAGSEGGSGPGKGGASDVEGGAPDVQGSPADVSPDGTGAAGATDANIPTMDPDAPVVSDAAAQPEGPPPSLTDLLFDDNAPVRTFELRVDPEDWAWLQANATKEEYVPCAVGYQGEWHEGAAVRFKGAYGSLFSCFDSKGNQLCSKLSLKVSFNEQDKDGRFHGVRKLVLNGCNRDVTCLRERVAYGAFRDSGLPAPRAVHATVSVNGGEPSLYTLVENIDRELLEELWDDPSGNLYKEVWPQWGYNEVYIDALKTNEDEADVRRMLELASLLAEVEDDDFDRALGPWIDLDAMARYLAVDQLTHNWDGIWKIYCNSNQCRNHNYYIYDDPGSGRMAVIPWDLDHTYSYPNADMGRSWSDDGPDACKVVQSMQGFGTKAPQCDPLLRGLMVLGWDRYLWALDELAAWPGAPVAAVTLLRRLDRYRAELIPFIEADPLGPSLIQWKKAVAQLRQIILEQHEEALKLLAEEGF